jgi:hypothetical protein
LPALRRAFWLALMLVAPLVAQGPPVHTRPPSGSFGGPFSDTNPDDIGEGEDRLRWLNKERQKAMVSDTNKLLKLAGELSAEVQNSKDASLTPEQVRKWAEVEKLAHSVKDKMSYSVRGTPTYREPSPVLP